jgi:prephenate dehydratase
MTITGVVGPAGTASHEAAVKTGAKNIKFFRDIAQVFSALEIGEISQGIVPIENVLRGTVTETVDMLMNIEPVIKKEILVPIKLAIACLPSSGKKDIKVIISDQRALAESLGYLNKNFPEPELKNVASAAFAMRTIAEEKLKDHAAIGSAFAAKHYGLKILDNDIEDRKNNVTRYILIEMKGETPRTGNEKTAVMVMPKEKEDKPGILYNVVGCFAKRNINLTNTILRPSIEIPGTYNFFIEFEGHQKDDAVRQALDDLKTKANFKVLGSYSRE